MKSVIITTLIFGLFLFHFSEGKPCPEETRAHSTRCDSYFRCVVLPSKSHVWVPTQCERGLIYEPNLRLCVLPGDDWECTLGDTVLPKKDENNIYGVDSLVLNSNQQKFDENNSKENIILIESKVGENSEEGDYIEVNSPVQSAAGNDNNNSELVASNKESSSDGNLEFSGDGSLEDMQMELKDGGIEVDDSKKVDPKLAAHLQRLSQIISGLKEKYQTKSEVTTDLRPDQLNAFLAHYNIRSQFDAIDPSVFDKRPVPQDGRIEPEVLRQILKKQQMLQNFRFPQNISISIPESSGYLPVPTIARPTPAYTPQIQLKPLKADKNYRRPEGYTNSQIVVNKPEGSVLFSLPPNDNYQPRPKPGAEEDPKISADTLKTVLELSKQMLANQNIRQVVPTNSIYHSVVQPMYVPVPMISSQQGSVYSNNYLPQPGFENDENYQKISSSSQPNRGYKRKPPHLNIQNDDVPYTTAASSASGMIPRPFNIEASEAAPSEDNNQIYQPQSNDRVDSYGNKLGFDNNKPEQSPHDQYSSFQNVGSQNQNTIYSTTLFPPLDYDLPPHVTPATVHTPNPNYDNSNANSNYYTRPPQPQSLYPTDLNGVQEMPKPIMQQPPQQFLQQQQPQYERPQTFIGAKPPAQHSASQFSYNQINSFPSPPQMRPINPTSVNIRPNSFQSSANGAASFTSPDAQNAILADLEESQFDYNQNNVINQIMTDLLASNVDHSSAAGSNQLVNLGGNFISYDVYKNQILPLLGSSSAPASPSNVEVITCSAGVRQANTTDCTKYYVCSKKDGKVLSYSCPPFTGFNSQTHICDAKTFAFCNPQAMYNRFTVSENRRIQMDAMQALEDAKKIRDQAIQAQNMANLIRLETQRVMNRTRIQQMPGLVDPTVLTGFTVNLPQQRPVLKSVAQPAEQPQLNLMKTKKKRQRIRCVDGAKVPDPESTLNYYVCFKSSEGKLKRRKMTCNTGLVFCGATLHCTLERKCSS